MASKTLLKLNECFTANIMHFFPILGMIFVSTIPAQQEFLEQGLNSHRFLSNNNFILVHMTNMHIINRGVTIQEKRGKQKWISSDTLFLQGKMRYAYFLFQSDFFVLLRA